LTTYRDFPAQISLGCHMLVLKHRYKVKYIDYIPRLPSSNKPWLAYASPLRTLMLVV